MTLGFVGQFLEIAPNLLHGGLCRQVLPALDQDDWWASMIADGELSARDIPWSTRLAPQPEPVAVPSGSATRADQPGPSAVEVEAVLGDAPHSNPSSDEEPDLAASALLQRIQEEVCLPLCMPLLKTGPRLRRSRTPATPNPCGAVVGSLQGPGP